MKSFIFCEKRWAKDAVGKALVETERDDEKRLSL